MFDIGFWELVFIFGLGLLILGPERLPRAAHTVGRWVAQARTVARRFQREIEREIAIADVKKRFEQERSQQPAPPESSEGTRQPAAVLAGPAPGTTTRAAGPESGTAAQSDTLAGPLPDPYTDQPAGPEQGGTPTGPPRGNPDAPDD